MNPPEPVSYEQLLARSDEWWEERLNHTEDGGMVVVAMGLCAVCGAVVGLAIGFLLG